MSGTQQIGKRITAVPTADGISIRIKAARDVFPLLLIPFWFAGWTYACADTIAVIRDSVARGNRPELFLLVWLCAWLVGGIQALRFWLWLAFGHELISITHDSFTCQRELLGLKWEKVIPLAEVRNLGVWDAGPSIADDFFQRRRTKHDSTAGAVAIDAAGKTYRFGIYLDEAEAASLVEAIKPLVLPPPQPHLIRGWHTKPDSLVTPADGGLGSGV